MSHPRPARQVGLHGRLLVDDTDLVLEYRRRIQDLLRNDQNELKSCLRALVSSLVLEETSIKIALG